MSADSSGAGDLPAVSAVGDSDPEIAAVEASGKGELPATPAMEARKPVKKKRRRAVRISEADQRIIDAGGSPSWEQIRSFEPNRWDGKRSSSESTEPESARDRAFRENRPPHW